jgi:wyosine [tRNA(Phe)-imidazoG37] synthetase (radical SAM superfamily)
MRERDACVRRIEAPVMNESSFHPIFGPVPSRRLGNSLGINNIPPKTCSYSCVYCQVGKTTEKCIVPRRFFTPARLAELVGRHLDRLQATEQGIDYLTFVPDGEPTLDEALGESIAALRHFGIPIAVITNSTLLWREDVRARVTGADLVSVKVDSVSESAWRRINRPHEGLELDVMLQGIAEFAAGYGGTLISETMLLKEINDGDEALVATANFLAGIAPRTAYVAVPTRPMVVGGFESPGEARLVRAHVLFSDRLAHVELLTGHESGDFGVTGNARDDLLAIAAVHPMRATDVHELLSRDHADWSLVDEMLSEGVLRAVDHAGDRFYLRPVVYTP